MTERKKESNALARDAGESVTERLLADGLERLATGTEILEVVPYAGIFVKGAKLVLGKRDERRAKRFFTILGELMGTGTAEETAKFVEEHIEHEWAQDAVARGIRDVIEATSEEARKCLIALVAMYMKNEQIPNLNFKRVAEFLRECDGPILSSALYILELFPFDAVPGVRGHNLAAQGNERTFEWTPVLDSSIGPKVEAVTPPHYEEVFTMLATARLGARANVYGGPTQRISRKRETDLALLIDCLRTAGIQPWKPTNAL